MSLVELDPEASTVRFLREGVLLDLGAIGKGYAVERAVGILEDAEVPGALVHGKLDLSGPLDTAWHLVRAWPVSA